MQHFPIFVNLRAQSVVVVGGGEAALAKLRLLLKSEAQISVYCVAPDRQIEAWAKEGVVTLHRADLSANELVGVRLIYAADEDPAKDAITAKLAKEKGVLVNIVDNLRDSQFITPAIVDRDPVTIAIGTEGTAPVLARMIKADFETRLSPALGLLARAAAAFRTTADALPKGRARRSFWADAFVAMGREKTNESPETILHALFEKHLTAKKQTGFVTFTTAAWDDPELLTLKARRALDEADVVIHDASVSPHVLELARREATFVRIDHMQKTPHLNRLIATHASKGAHVLRLSSLATDLDVLNRCQAQGFTCDHIASLAPPTPALLQKETA